LRLERGFPASVAAEPVVAPWIGLMTRSALVANCLEIEPWSEAEEARALDLRDVQSQRDGIKLEEE
jgi:hypothetical protein